MQTLFLVQIAEHGVWVSLAIFAMSIDAKSFAHGTGQPFRILPKRVKMTNLRGV